MRADRAGGAEPASCCRAAHQQWLSLGMVVRSDRLERTYPWLLSRGPRPRRLGQRSTRPASAASSRPFRPPRRWRAWPRSCSAPSPTPPARFAPCCSSATRTASRSAPYRESGATTTIDRVVADVPRTTGSTRSPRTGRSQGRHGCRPGRRPRCLAVPVRMRDRTIGVVYAEHHGPPPGLRHRARGGAGRALRPGRRAAVEPGARGQAAGGRGAAAVADRRPVAVHPQRAAAHPRHRRHQPGPAGPPGRAAR